MIISRMDNNILSALIAVGGVIIGTFLQYFISKLRANEDREADFRIKLFELKISAAKKAYQYLFLVHRAYVRNSQDTSRADRIVREARDWLDGEALILGNDIYKAVYTYFNSAQDKDRRSFEFMEDAQKKLGELINDRS